MIADMEMKWGRVTRQRIRPGEIRSGENGVDFRWSKAIAIHKFRNYTESGSGRPSGFANFVHVPWVSIAKKPSALAKVRDAAGREPHQASTHRVARYRIVGEHNPAWGRGVPLSGPLPSMAMMPSAMTK